MHCLKKLRGSGLMVRGIIVFLFLLLTMNHLPITVLADWSFDATPPTCTITAPNTIAAGSTVYIIATATDSLSLINSVILYKNGSTPFSSDRAGEYYLDPSTFSSPRARVYKWTVGDLSPGDRVEFTANATDTAGNLASTCVRKTITITGGPTATPVPPTSAPGGGTPPVVTVIPTNTPTPTGYYPAWLYIQGGDVHVNK